MKPSHEQQEIDNAQADNYYALINKIAQQIKSGYRIIIILRGAPGSGKSYLAKNLVERSMLLSDQYNLGDFILSTDDYFFDRAGRYRYSIDKLDDAHAFNQRRVREKAAAGWSPIIVDNTNMKLWEILPYAEIAVRNGYLIELLEPNTPWRFSAGKLALKNQHRVPREKIQIMLNKYENGNVADIMKMLNGIKHTVPLPQIRALPYIQTSHQNSEIDEKLKSLQFQEAKKKPSLEQLPSSCFEASNKPLSVIANAAPKEQRDKHRAKYAAKPLQDVEKIELPEPISSNVWEPYDLESKNFWGVKSSNDDQTTITPVKANEPRAEKTLLDLLKEGVNEVETALRANNNLQSSPLQKSKFERHSIDCVNELPEFASLRQIYPNKQIVGLWDLFVKCNGDIDWAVDILLKEDELFMCDDKPIYNENEDLFECGCYDDSKKTETVLNATENIKEPQVNVPKKKPPRYLRMKQRTNVQHLEVQEAVANRFVLGEEFYSKELRKIRDIRNGNFESAPKILTSMETQTEPLEDDEEEEEEEENEIIELSLGEDLVQQLTSIFNLESTLGEQLSKIQPTNVFIPRTLAKEIYMLCVESAYNQMEEQRQQMLREDENFARLLKNPKYENITNSPNNVQELLDGELAWNIYNSEENKEPCEDFSLESADLATHLTRMKLCEAFPDIPRETLLDILKAHGGRYNETVKVLRSTMDCNDQLDLLDLEVNKNDLLSRKMDINLTEQQQQQRSELVSTHSSENERDRTTKAILQQPEDIKRLALINFEEMRNLATHHSQLKAECYQKAKEAIQKGNSAVAVYYSEIASVHKNKIEDCNHRAASCIMDVHKYTQNNPNLLDLHYLFLAEAVSCLDLFLDRHITELRTNSRIYKNVFIITGRGLHSTGGVATIKNKVKSRLKERNLRWTEVNPGLLKVKVFSASRHSKNI